MATVRLATLAVLVGFCAVCGYRPAGSLVVDSEATVWVPAFVSFAGYPELDVYSGAYLASRLAAHGLRTTSSEGDAALAVQGRLLSATEVPRTVNALQTVLEVHVQVQIAVISNDGGTCDTPVAERSAVMPATWGANTEPERVSALQSATVDAIDGLLLDILLCAEESANGL